MDDDDDDDDEDDDDRFLDSTGARPVVAARYRG